MINGELGSDGPINEHPIIDTVHESKFIPWVRIKFENCVPVMIIFEDF